MACVFLAVLFAGIADQAWHRPAPAPTIDAGVREVMLLDGCVVEPTVLSNDREQFTLELDWRARARVSLSLRDGETPQKLDYGQRVEIEARIREPHNYNNPGSFDYAAYLARQYIYWTASMPAGSKARLLPGRCGSRAMAAIYALRVAALERIERLYPGDDYSTGMMEAILIGESSKLERVWTENFRRTGTYHALVISGVHVSVLAGVLLFLLRAMPEVPALTVTAAAAWLYAMVSGFSPPVARAAAGFTLFLLARFFFRRGRVLNLLAAVALVYLAFDPGLLFDASFELSFLCVAAIGALAVPILDATSGPLSKATRAINDRSIDPHIPPRAAQFRVELRLMAQTVELWMRLPVKYAASAIALVCRIFLFAFEMALISAVVQIGLALPMAEYFHRVSFSGLTANLLIVPLLNCVVPIGFFAIFTGWRWMAAMAGGLLKLAARIADWHARLEPDWRIPDPPLWLALAFLASLAAVAISIRRRIWRWPALASSLVLFTLLIWQPWPPQIRKNTLELTAIDVGQGDSLLVVFPKGQTMIVDGGGLLQYGRARRSNLDIGEDVVSPYLFSREIRRLDVVVATHSDADHSGGIVALLDNFHPREVWVGANPLPRIVQEAARLHIPVIAKRAGAPFAFGGANIEILSPPEDYAATRPGNNDSLAFRIAYGSRSFLLTGDMERPMERLALENGEPLRADVLKVAHHGSKTSTTQPFLDAVSPSIAIISDGYQNSFGHPHPEVLARLAERHTEILRTDLDGLVTVRTDGKQISADTMLWRGSSEWLFGIWEGEHGFNWALASDW